MKALRLNSKHILPVALIGLLSLNVSWDAWLNTNPLNTFDQASSDLTRTLSDDSLDACDDGSNQILSALKGAQAAKSRNTTRSTEFYIYENSDEEDFEDRVKGKDVTYNGRVRVEAVIPKAMTHSDLVRKGYLQSGTIGDSLGADSATNTTQGVTDKMHPVTDADGNERMVPYKYRIFNLTVSSETTEASSCDGDCYEGNQIAKKSRPVIIQVWPTENIGGSADVFSCRRVYEEAVDMFSDAKKEMIKSVRKDLEDIAKELEEDELRETRKRLMDTCQVKGRPSLDDIKEYEEEGEIDSIHSYDDDLEGELKCHRKKLSKLKGEERHKYFKEHMYKDIRALLTSSDAADRELGEELLTKMEKGDFGDLMNIDRHMLRQARSGMWAINRVYKLKKAYDRERNPLIKNSIGLEIDQITMSLDARSNFNRGADEEYDFWHGAINDILGKDGWQVKGDDPVGPINIRGRVARGGAGLSSELMREIRGLTATFDRNTHRYGYYNDDYGIGTDAYERNFAKFGRTTVPGGREFSRDSGARLNARPH